MSNTKHSVSKYNHVERICPSKGQMMSKEEQRRKYNRKAFPQVGDIVCLYDIQVYERSRSTEDGRVHLYEMPHTGTILSGGIQMQYEVTYYTHGTEDVWNPCNKIMFQAVYPEYCARHHVTSLTTRSIAAGCHRIEIVKKKGEADETSK